MITYLAGNLLLATTDMVVNPCNTVGVMGAGLAKQIRDKFPECVRPYETACRAGKLMPGKVLIVPTAGSQRPFWIAHVPTKRHWKDPSTLELVTQSLRALVEEITKRIEITQVSIPALGCELGGLQWSAVKIVMEAELSQLDEVDFFVYLPK